MPYRLIVTDDPCKTLAGRGALLRLDASTRPTLSCRRGAVQDDGVRRRLRGPRAEPQRAVDARERLPHPRLRRRGLPRGDAPDADTALPRARCRNPATARGRCDEHRTARERDRSRVRRADAKGRNRMYARKRWAMFRRHKLYLDPLCEPNTTAASGSPTRSTTSPRWRTAAPAYDMDNVVSTCKPCHSRETTPRNGGEGREGAT